MDKSDTAPSWSKVPVYNYKGYLFTYVSCTIHMYLLDTVPISLFLFKLDLCINETKI